MLIPPDFNVSVTDWERSLRLREGKFAVLEADPDHSAAATATATVTTTLAPAARPPSESGMVAPPPEAAAAAPGPAAAAAAAPSGGGADADAGVQPPSTLARYSGLSSDELADIRARLERLLSQ